jgi:hypothetical protein
VRSTSADPSASRDLNLPDIRSLSSQEIFGAGQRAVLLGGATAKGLSRSAQGKNARDLSVYLARSGNRAVVLMIESSPTTGTRFHYAEADSFIGPAFAFQAAADRTYFFQCLPNTELHASNDSTAPDTRTTAYSGRSAQ